MAFRAFDSVAVVFPFLLSSFSHSLDLSSVTLSFSRLLPSSSHPVVPNHTNTTANPLFTSNPPPPPIHHRRHNERIWRPLRPNIPPPHQRRIIPPSPPPRGPRKRRHRSDIRVQREAQCRTRREIQHSRASASMAVAQQCQDGGVGGRDDDWGFGCCHGFCKVVLAQLRLACRSESGHPSQPDSTGIS